MAYETPSDLIKQLQISLRGEAKLSSYDPSDASIPSLPSAASAISELDPSPSYLRCKNCKGRLLRGLESIICVFCGKQQQADDNPPDPIKFTSTFGYKWLLGSLNLDGSEMVEPRSEGKKLNRGRKAPAEKVALSSLLDFQIQWRPVEEKPSTGLDEKFAQTKVLLNLAGVDLDNYFTEGKDDAPGAQVSPNQPVENTINKNLKDHGSLSLFENAGGTEQNSFQYGEGWKSSHGSDAFGSSSSTGQGSLSLFEKAQPSEMLAEFVGEQTSSSSKGHNSLCLFENSQTSEASVNFGDAQGISSAKAYDSLGLLENTQPSEASVNFGDAQRSSSSKGYDNLDLFEKATNEASVSFGAQGNSTSDQIFDSSGAGTLSGKLKSHDPVVASSIDLSAHMDTVFGTVNNISGGKPNDSFTASGPNSSDWFQDDLWSKATHQFEKKDVPVNDKEAVHSNSMDVDWVQNNNLWQTSTNNKTSATIIAGDEDEWNDFTSSAGVKNPSCSSLPQVGVGFLSGDFDGPPISREGSTSDSAKDSSATGVDYIENNQGEPSSHGALETVNKDQEDHFFDHWNDFTSAASTKMHSAMYPEQFADHTGFSSRQTSDDISLFGSTNKPQSVELSSFSKPDLFSGAFSNQNISPEAKNVDLVASNSDRDGGGDRNSADDVEKVMSEMHDLSFMLESKLSLPPKTTEGCEQFPKS